MCERLGYLISSRMGLSHLFQKRDSLTICESELFNNHPNHIPHNHQVNSPGAGTGGTTSFVLPTLDPHNTRQLGGQRRGTNTTVGEVSLSSVCRSFPIWVKFKCKPQLDSISTLILSDISFFFFQPEMLVSERKSNCWLLVLCPLFRYVFTDLSQAFLTNARNRFSRQ